MHNAIVREVISCISNSHRMALNFTLGISGVNKECKTDPLQRLMGTEN